jgi:hypothetical protein
MPTEVDEHLRRRLRAVQEHHGLTGDGVAGTQTWTKLMAAPAAASSGPGAAGSGSAAAGSGSAAQQVVIPLSDYPHLHALLAAESLDRWLAELGIGEQQAGEEAQA